MNPLYNCTDMDFTQLKAELLPFVTVENFVTLLKAVTFYADPDTYVGIAVYIDDPAGRFAADFGSIDPLNTRLEVIDTEMLAGATARSALHSVFVNDNMVS